MLADVDMDILRINDNVAYAYIVNRWSYFFFLFRIANMKS